MPVDGYDIARMIETGNEYGPVPTYLQNSDGERTYVTGMSGSEIQNLIDADEIGEAIGEGITRQEGNY